MIVCSTQLIYLIIVKFLLANVHCKIKSDNKNYYYFSGLPTILYHTNKEIYTTAVIVWNFPYDSVMKYHRVKLITIGWMKGLKWNDVVFWHLDWLWLAKDETWRKCKRLGKPKTAVEMNSELECGKSFPHVNRLCDN